MSLWRDPSSISGRSFYTGDRSAVMHFSVSGKGYATIHVDATKDKRGICWPLIDGKTLGLVIRPLGALNASSYASSSREGREPSDPAFQL